MFQDLEFFISEAIIGMRRSGMMILIAIATICVSLTVFGIFLLLTANVNNLANFVTGKLEIRVFLSPNLSRREIADFRMKLREINGVKDVVFIHRNDAWKQFQNSFRNIELGNILNDNPLPHSFRVMLSDNQKIVPVSTYISTYRYYVDDVRYGGVLAQRIQAFSRITKLSGLILSVLLSLATLLIVVNTIRLTVLARQEEIEIMFLVGATKSFIKGPFIIEGLVMGMAGSIVSLLLLNFGYMLLGNKFQEGLPFFPVLYSTEILNEIYLIIGISGILLGVFGAYISVSKSLKTFR